MKIKEAPELVALALAVVAAVACVVGLAVSLSAPPWVAWGLGLLLSGIVAARLGARALDERTNRAAAAMHREKTLPEPPYRPIDGPAPDQL